MKNFLNLRNAKILAAFLFLTISVVGQSSRPDFNRKSDFDVQHYILRVSFDRPSKKVLGDTTVRLKPLTDNFRRVTLDSVGISYTSVTLEQGGTPLNFRTQNGSVVVDLDRAYSPSESVGIRFQYSAVPKKGIYFIPPMTGQGGPSRSAQIWTQGEPEEARHWFPSFDFPSDKATTEQYITANRNETVVGNGAFVDKVDNADGTVTHHFKMEVPFSTYLVSFVIGEYAVVKETYKEISLGYYVYPGTESVVPKAFGKTRDMVRNFEEVTQVAFPYPKYDQTIVSGFDQFSGMENITATTMADTDIFMVNNPLFASGVEDLVSHELAHSWFGDMVTCKNWAELWLNEGFATFMEAVSREKFYGRRAYIAKVMSDAEQFLAEDAVTPKRYGLFNRTAADVNSLFDRSGTTYNKGGAVLHTLREEVGDRAFWLAVKIYLDRHKFGNVESTDLKKAMEETSGKDLGWFFDQWVYGLGSPKLSVKQIYNAASKTVVLTVTQTQKLDRLTPPAFRMDLDVDIHSGNGVNTEKLELRKRVETFRFKLASKPTKLVFDKDEKVPIKTVKILPPAN